ncbi:restriction endonuclease subunit S [Streptomyces sp. NPDC056944]|uniref:restriction endonuclease subunit S n=1 Tax=Streptomyces sp. NPDC056944 TaxID=3345972 RepID=UPI0036448425
MTEQRYAAYKTSGSSWIGDIPNHWTTSKLRHLMREKRERGRPDLPLLSVVRDRGVINRMTSTDVVNHNRIPDDLRNYKVARAGDLVINKMKAWQGSLGISPIDGIVSPAYFVFGTTVSNRDFANILFRSAPYTSHFGELSDGVRVGQWDLSLSGIREIPVFLPPADEQLAIVKYLRYIQQEVEAAVHTKRRLVSLIIEQKEAIRHAYLTRGLDMSEPLKESEIPGVGLIPERWEVMRVKQLCQRIVDCKNRTPELVPNGGYTVVRTTNIRSGNFRPQGSFETDRENYEIWTQRGAPRPGDVFFTREAPAGEACVVPDLPGLCMGQRMMYLRPNPETLEGRYLVHSIYGPAIRTYIDLATNGSTVGHLRLGQVGALPVIWCPVEEQRAIVDRIDQEWAPLNAAISRAEREITLLREYQTRLTADVVTGKLDVRAAAAALPDVDPHDPDLVTACYGDEGGMNADLDGDDAVEESM